MKIMKVRVLGMLAILSVASGMLAQTTTPQSGSGIDSDIALLRSDVQAQKTDVIAHTMQFTDAQSQAFWPLYREYAGKQQAIGDQRVKLIKDYADSYDTMDDAKADELAGRMIKFDDARTKLRAEYYPKFKKAIGAKQAAKFLQVDNRLTLLVDLQIATAVPIIQ
jgi:Spy/CpxP family protein refolding chaperone